MNTDEPHIDIRLVPGAVTCWTVTAAGILWSPAVIVAIVVGAAAGTAMAGRWCARRGLQLGAAGVAAVAVIGTAFGLSIALRAHDARHHPIAVRHGHTATVGVVPTESPRSLGQGRIMFRGGLLELDGNPLTGMVLVFAPVTDFAELTVGRPATFRARIGRPLRPDLSVALLTAIGEPTLGAVPTVRRLSGHIRSEFADTARRVLPAEQSAMLPALVLGDMSAVPATTADDFKIAGLTHLTAVSGANVTIVCGTALLVAALVGPRLAALLALAVLIGFVVVVEPSASVLRAAVMGGIALLAVLTHRRRQAIPVLSASVVALLAVAPQAGRRCGVRAVGGGDGRPGRDRPDLVGPPGRARLAHTAGRRGEHCAGRSAGHRPADRRDLGPVQRARGPGQSAGRRRHPADHGDRHRRGGAVGLLAAGGGHLDPLHRAGAVVAADGGGPDRGGAGGPRSSFRPASSVWRWSPR